MSGQNDFEIETDARLAALEASGVEVLIIGAGINGAGLFRDLCAQGIRCLIVDKNDFGSGTSAASSRLIHGGLKYLETGEFRLVAQSTLERNLLLKNAPHCVQPLLTVIPIFSWMRGVGAAVGTFFGAKTLARSRGALLVKAGLTLYDFYGARERMMPRHRMLSRRRALQEFPALSDKIKAAATYFDAKVSRPERLVWELVRDGLDDTATACALNYCDVLGHAKGEVILQRHNGAQITLSPLIVVNAAGPWIDAVNLKLGAPSHLIGGTKGSHILLDHPELMAMLAGRMIYFEANDGRICLAFEYNGKVLVGSTDQKADDPDSVICEGWETDYFIERLRAIFPKLKFDPNQVVYAYSGIRPLPASDAANPGLITRDHSAPVAVAQGERPFPIISMVGGKWTTFRGFAEEVADDLVKRLGKARRASTRAMAIGGGKDYPADAATHAAWLNAAALASGMPAPRLSEMLARYGTTALAVARHRGAWRDGDRLEQAPQFSLSEFDWIAAHEGAHSIADLVLRRTTLGLGHTLSRPDVCRLAEVLGARLGWDAREKERQIEIFATEMASRHGVRLSSAMELAHRPASLKVKSSR